MSNRLMHFLHASKTGIRSERLDRVPLWNKTVEQGSVGGYKVKAVVWVKEMLSWISSHPI